MSSVRIKFGTAATGPAADSSVDSVSVVKVLA
jgi:hypothetical protein